MKIIIICDKCGEELEFTGQTKTGEGLVLTVQECNTCVENYKKLWSVKEGEITMKEIILNGKIYIEKTTTVEKDDLKYVLIRTYSAGIHIGYLKSRNGSEATLFYTRRIWKWDGAFSLSELSQNGPTKPSNCKLSIEIPENTILNVIECLPVSQKAFNILNGIKAYEC